MSRDYEVCTRLGKVESVGGWGRVERGVYVCVKVENVLIRRGDERGGRVGGWAMVGRACKEEVGLENG